MGGGGATTGRGGKRARLASGVALGLILLVPGVAGAWVVKTGPRRLKHCWSYMRKIERGTASPHNFVQLAREGKDLGFVERFLEARCQEAHGEHRDAALKALFLEFPQSESARAVREYESLAGGSYFAYDEEEPRSLPVPAHALTPAEKIARWRAFVSEYPDFPGRDNAGYELARCEEESGDALGAFETLHDALEWGDQDAAGKIASRLANVIDAQLSLDQTLALVDRVDARYRALLRYSGAVKLAQAWRFEEAVARLDSFAAGVAGGDEVALVAQSRIYFVWRGQGGKPTVRTGALLADVARQRALWARLARLLAQGESASERGARARSFRRMGDSVVTEAHAFENFVLHDHVNTDRHGERPWAGAAQPDERFAAYSTRRNHLAQAAAFYEVAAREGTPGFERTRALVGAASARLGLLGFWSQRGGHQVAQDWESRVDAAARAVALALAAGASEGTRPEVELRLAAAWSGMVVEVRQAVREGRDRQAWPVASEYQVARDLRKRAVAFWRESIEKPALALGHKQGG